MIVTILLSRSEQLTSNMSGNGKKSSRPDPSKWGRSSLAFPNDFSICSHMSFVIDENWSSFLNIYEMINIFRNQFIVLDFFLSMIDATIEVTIIRLWIMSCFINYSLNRYTLGFGEWRTRSSYSCTRTLHNYHAKRNIELYFVVAVYWHVMFQQEKQRIKDNISANLVCCGVKRSVCSCVQISSSQIRETPRVTPRIRLYLTRIVFSTDIFRCFWSRSLRPWRFCMNNFLCQMSSVDAGSRVFYQFTIDSQVIRDKDWNLLFDSWDWRADDLEIFKLVLTLREWH